MNEQEIAESLRPLGNVDRIDKRVVAVEALHTYICAACGYDLERAMTIFRRVITTLDLQLGAKAPAE